MFVTLGFMHYAFYPTNAETQGHRHYHVISLSLSLSLYIYIYKRFMVLTSSFGELVEDQMLQYYYIGLNINDRVYIYIYI